MVVGNQMRFFFRLFPIIILVFSCSPKSNSSQANPTKPNPPKETCDTVAKTNPPKEVHNISYPFNGKLDQGVFDSKHYQNKYFGFSIDAPDANWTVLNREQYAARIKSNLTALNASDSASKKSENNLHNLFTIRKNQQRAAFQSISFTGEGLEKIPDVTNALEYIKWTDKFVADHLSSGFPKYKVLSLDSGMLGNREFLLSIWKIERSPGIVYFQKTYTAQFGKYVLNVIENYQSHEDSLENEKILSTIKWK